MTLLHYPRIAIAALKGGAGKTVISTGIIMALRHRGLKIVPFKKGPDYIDAGWLALAAQRPCYNLDPFLMEKEQVLLSFKSRARTGECAIIEGNRGLYDGTDEAGTYSTAELSKLLEAPVILVLDCSKVTRTAAAMVLGCQKFDPAVSIKGVILNQIARSRHEAMIRNTIEQYCGLPVIGALPRLPEGELPERHMGLTPIFEHGASSQALVSIKNIVESYVDLDKLLSISREAGCIEDCTHKYFERPAIKANVGIIRDSAFQFYYPENLEEIARNGAGLVDISPLRDSRLPDLDALYIGGGFPETHAELLAANRSFADSLRTKVEAGLPVYAECGGLIYLGRSITVNGTVYPMSGILPVDFHMGRKPQGHGYTEMVAEYSNPFFSLGRVLKGHEFHYSRVHKWDKGTGMYMALRVKRGHGVDGERDGFCYKNVFATYMHIHALGIREWAESILKRAVEFRDRHDTVSHSVLSLGGGKASRQVNG